MKYTLVLFILILLNFITSKAQVVSLEDLKNTIVAKHSINPDTVDFCDFIVVDGVPYSVTDIESGQEIILKDKLKIFEFLKMPSNLHHKKCDWLLLLGSGVNQQSKEKKALINKLKENYQTVDSQTVTLADGKCDDCMAILVDGKALNEQESMQIVSKLKARNVAHISFYKNANSDYYGYRAKNGMMEIFMKD